MSFLTDGEHYDAAHAYRVDDLAFWLSFVPAMLARARAKATDVEAVWLEADMRTFDDARDQDLAILAFNAINLLEVDDALACLGCVREHLPRSRRRAVARARSRRRT
jgi:hypothetical protein